MGGSFIDNITLTTHTQNEMLDLLRKNERISSRFRLQFNGSEPKIRVVDKHTYILNISIWTDIWALRAQERQKIEPLRSGVEEICCACLGLLIRKSFPF